MKPFNHAETSFGRHETFPLRFTWPTKGFRYWCEGHEVFDDENATVRLGVGKNMVSSIRYWLIAAQLVDNPRDNGIVASEIGKLLLSPSTGWDPYLEDDTTIWLIHWLIASNPAHATGFYWFFNKFHKPEFSSSEVTQAHEDFVKENVSSKVSPSTLKHDMTVLLRMYAPPELDSKIPLEESLDSPMTQLGLLQRSVDGKHFMTRLSERQNLSIAALSFAVLDCMESRNLTSISLELLARSDERFSSPGSVFRLTEEGLITKLEELTRIAPGYFELRETAGIRQFYKLDEISKLQLLGAYYKKFAEDLAA